MLVKHKNLVFRLLQKYSDRLDLRRFSTHAEDEVFSINYTDTPFWFRIRYSPSSYDRFDCRWTLFAPGFPECEFVPRDTWTSFGEVLTYLDTWLSNTLLPNLANSEEVDLWEQFLSNSTVNMTSPPTAEDFHPHTSQECATIRSLITEFRTLIIRSFQPTPDQLVVITQRLDYLSAALERLNRFDWRALAVTTVLAIGVNLCVDTNTGRTLWNLFRQAFAGAVHFLPPLFGLPSPTT